MAFFCIDFHLVVALAIKDKLIVIAFKIENKKIYCDIIGRAISKKIAIKKRSKEK